VTTRMRRKKKNRLRRKKKPKTSSSVEVASSSTGSKAASSSAVAAKNVRSVKVPKQKLKCQRERECIPSSQRTKGSKMRVNKIRGRQVVCLIFSIRE
jgi:hypothetical protein